MRPMRAALSLASTLVALTLALVASAPSAAMPLRESGTPHAGQGEAAGDYSINLYEDSDFVSQATPYWCIGASMQMMLNVIGVDDDDSRASQERNMLLARSLGPSLRQVDHGQSAGGLRGAGSSGWARGPG